jgi:pyruvate formate lyase activating enzyme
MPSISKREFIKQSLTGACGLCCVGSLASSQTKVGLSKWSRESMFYSVTPKEVRCELCPNECSLSTGDTGDCHSRLNVNGKLYTIAYGNPCAVHVDPIEKKPLLHFYPSTKIYSIATAGCNMACLNCQNWEISQTSPKNTQNSDLMPASVVENCIKNGCPSIAYTYSEPITFYEYMYDTAVIAHDKGLKNVLVSNGYVNEKPLLKLAPLLDAANIDLKAFSDDVYMRLTGGKLQPVLNTLKSLKDTGVWLEVTNLVVPSWTDNMDTIKQMCEWLVNNGFSAFPLHLTRFHPQYKLTQLPETPLQTLLKAKEIAVASGCKYVYIGNVPGKGYENVHCPRCKKVVVERIGFSVISNSIKNSRCSFCGTKIDGRW